MVQQRQLIFAAVCATMVVVAQCAGHVEAEAPPTAKHDADILRHHRLNQDVHLHEHDDHGSHSDHDGHDDHGDVPGPQEAGGAPLVGHRCIHDQIVMKNPPTVEQTYAAYPKWSKRHTEGNSQTHHRVYEATSTDYNNMRIKFYFDVDNVGKCGEAGVFVNSYQNNNENVNCSANDVLTALKRDYILNSLMPQAVNFLRGALNVIPVSGALVAPASCHGITTPSSHQNPGISDADFVAYVTAVPLASTSGNGTVAWATACAYDGDGRPIAGHINFVPSALSNAAVRKPYLEAQDVNTAIHEACHALGFSSQFFGQYVDMDNVRHGSGGKETSNDATLGKSVTKFVSPRVVAAAKTYFGCSTMTGVEIEDQGGAGTQGSHWEKRILYEEFIAGVLSSARTYISTFTLAYFEDTGFFTANYEYAEDANMRWGKGKGCPFLQEKCNSATNKASGEFCFDSNAATRYCTSDRTAGGKCDVTTYSSIASAFRYFEDPKLGAQVLVSDYCPAVIPFSDKICIEAKNSDIQDIYGNTYHSASRCFVSNLIQSDFDEGSQQDSRCFPYSCSIVTGQLLLNIRGQTARCPSDLSAGYADLSKVSGYKGVILCPAASELCSDFNAPTPAPTPAPPTPVPTPAPPGFTPAPAPVERTSKQWYNFNMPATCAGRASCAANLSSLFPACRLLAKRLVDCYGTNCDGDIMSWLSDKGLTSKCQDTSTAATLCQDSFVGADALCRLATGSAASTTVLVAMLALLVGLLATVV